MMFRSKKRQVKKDKPLSKKDVEALLQQAGSSDTLDLSSRKFEKGIDLSRLDLHGANLTATDMERANMRGANLRNADLHGANLGFAIQGEDTDPHVLATPTNLEGANLSEANLRGANLDNAYLRGANLSRADLSGAYLGFSDLSGADLRGATVDNWRLESARSLQSATMPDGTKHP